MTVDWRKHIEGELSDVDSFIKGTLKSGNEELNEMCEYVMSSSGKHIRPSLCILSYLACGGKDSEKAVTAGSAMEIVHCASLIHDDINDSGEMRRGRKTLHREYTTSKAIIAGDFLFAKGFSILGGASQEVVESIVNAASAMAESEFMQKDLERSIDISEEEYMDIIKGKTAMLMVSSAFTGALLADAKPKTLDAIARYVEEFGKAFQIIDDTLDIVGDAETTGKKTGLDIMEGKPTLPLIYAMRDPKRGKRVREIFSSKEPCQSMVDEALRLINETDAVDMCRAKAKSIVEAAKPLLSEIPDSVYKKSLLDLSDFIVERDR